MYPPPNILMSCIDSFVTSRMSLPLTALHALIFLKVSNYCFVLLLRSDMCIDLEKHKQKKKYS